MKVYEDIRNTMNSLVGELRYVPVICETSNRMSRQIGEMTTAIDMFNQSCSKSCPSQTIHKENKFGTILKKLNPFRLFSKLFKKSNDYEIDMSEL